MRVNIVTRDGIKHKYTVENLDSAMDIIKDYAKENNLGYEGPNGITEPISKDNSYLLGIANFFKRTNSFKHFEGSAFIWSK